ncbi:MAG: FecR domain-containing protein [Rhizobiales bacterium]|nr:FecR domain-containing protein [Hyphomicrobiales bacterium]
MVELNRRKALLVAALLPAFMPAAETLAAAEAVGTVTELKGKASAELAGKTRALKLKAPVHLTETLITGGGEARLTALLAERTTLKLGARTKVRIDSFIVDSGGELSFNSGALLLDAPSQSFEKGLTIDSRFALIAVRGTKFFAGRLGEAFSVFVEEGAVDVTAAGQTVRLASGEGTDIANPGDPPGEVRRWGAPKIARAMALVE